LKLKKASLKYRDPYTCHFCKTDIKHGDMYLRKSKSIGSPHKPDKIITTESGGIAFEMQGIRYDIKICESCSNK
jgi:hypothetical protein